MCLLLCKQTLPTFNPLFSLTFMTTGTAGSPKDMMTWTFRIKIITYKKKKKKLL